MIREYKKSDSSKILYVINDAAIRYKGIIPDNCWHEPYMSEQELVNEFNAGVRMFGYNRNNKLIAVIGIQKIKDVILIRHAYTLTQYQGTGVGKSLLEYLLQTNQSTCFLVGTWRDAPVYTALGSTTRSSILPKKVLPMRGPLREVPTVRSSITTSLTVIAVAT